MMTNLLICWLMYMQTFSHVRKLSVGLTSHMSTIHFIVQLAMSSYKLKIGTLIFPKLKAYLRFFEFWVFFSFLSGLNPYNILKIMKFWCSLSGAKPPKNLRKSRSICPLERIWQCKTSYFMLFCSRAKPPIFEKLQAVVLERIMFTISILFWGRSPRKF